MSIEWIDEVSDLAGKVVLLRAGLNVPMQEGEVVNDFRIRKALPTLRCLQEQGAKTVVIAHIGRDPEETLAPVAEALSEHIPATFATLDSLDTAAMGEGDIVVLENLRQDAREVDNDETFAKELAARADIFVQDAFSVCHREHASIVGIPKWIPSYGGLLLRAETSVLTRALRPHHPALFILGGAKFKTKEPLIKKFLDVYDTVFIGGALQNEVLAARGYAVGASVIEDGEIPSDMLLNDALLPVHDVVVEREGGSTTVPVESVQPNDIIVDIGEHTIRDLIATLPKYKTILWNGPLGWYEKGFSHATKAVARAIAAQQDIDSTVGGGDTVAVVQGEGLEDEFEFVSTGGGAMLEFLLNGTLPGLEALGAEKKS